MKRRFTILTFLIGLGISCLAVQPETEGFNKLVQKDYIQAKRIFAGLLKNNAQNSAALFGLGQCCYYEGKTDSAKAYYEKGLGASSGYAGNYAGMGILEMKSNSAGAEDFFRDAVKKSKKDATALVAIAQAFFESTPKNLEEAQRYIKLAIGVDNKNASAYFLNGLIELEKKNNSEASLQFDRTLYYDPNFLEAYLFQADVMVGARNYPMAIESVNKALAINSEYWAAYKKLGELYYNSQKYADAVKNFATYFQHVGSDGDVTHYAYSLFFDKQYDAARKMIDHLVQENPNDYVLLRLLGYISYETKDYAAGKTYLEKFFQLIPAEKILTDDYSYYGKMLSASGNDSLAVVFYNKALSKDSTDYQLYDELAKSCNKLRRYNDYLNYSCQFVNRKPNLVTADYFQLGKAFYSVANSLDVKTDSIRQLQYFHKADSLFSKVEAYSPNSYLGTFWRARVNSAIDKETTLGLAKPFYEKVFETLNKDQVKYKKEISEIYAYLGFYYFQKEDKMNSLDYWKKLLEVDPENLKAQEAIKLLEKK